MNELSNNMQYADIINADTETLRRALHTALTISAKQLGYLAMIWAELERRGEDLSALRSGVSAYLPMIAAGKLEADLVIKYAGQKILLAAMGRMAIDKQRKLAVEGEVILVQVGTKGERIDSKIPLHRLASTDVRRAFSDDGLRDPDDQYRLLEKSRKKPASTATRTRKSKVKFSDSGDSIVVGKYSVPLDRLLPVMSDHYGFDVKALIEDKLRQSLVDN